MNKIFNFLLMTCITAILFSCGHIGQLPKTDQDFQLSKSQILKQYPEMSNYPMNPMDWFSHPIWFWDFAPAKDLKDAWGKPTYTRMSWYTLWALGSYWHRIWEWEKGNYIIRSRTTRPFFTLYLVPYIYGIEIEEIK